MSDDKMVTPEREDDKSHHSSSEEDHDSDDSEGQSRNNRKLLKVMEKLRHGHLKRTVGKWQHDAMETKIRYHGPYHDLWGERFYLPKQFMRPSRKSLTCSGNHDGQKRRPPGKMWA